MRKLLLPLLVVLLLPLSQPLVANEPAPHDTNAVILTYQRLGERHHSMYVSEQTFRAHLDYLQNNGFKVWPLERIVRRLRTGQTIPDKTVAITFDRTHPSIYEIAYPLLKERGWPFTVFVVPDKVDQIPRGNMSWEQMREMKKHGARFANSSINHIHLVRPLRGYPPRAWVHYVRDNVLNAQARLQEELGSDTNNQRLFAYPYGEYSTALANILAEIGYTAFGNHPGAISRHTDLRSLPRFTIDRNTGRMERFANRVNSVALPVTKLNPWNPHITNSQVPILSMTLAPTPIEPKYLSCHTREGHNVQVKWRNRDHTSVEISYAGELNRGYNYYQCTSRYGDSQRLYWFSQPWVIAHTTHSKTPEEQEAEEQAKDLKDVEGGESTPGDTTAPPAAVEPAPDTETPSEPAPATETPSEPAPADTPADE